MKDYVLTPKNKKSIYEVNQYVKEHNDTNLSINREVVWRSGSFSIPVPETKDEIDKFLNEEGYDTLDEFLEDYESIEEKVLPSDDEKIEMIIEDFNAELIDTFDGSQDWHIECNDEELSPDEDELNEILEEVKEAFEEEGEDGLSSLGWEEAYSDFEIWGDYSLELM